MKSIRENNGYRRIYKPEHPSCMTSDNWKGYIYEHRYVVEIAMGRLLKDDEVVHHLDCNRSNNRIENLLVLSNAMHSKLHSWIDGGMFIHDSYVVHDNAIRSNKIDEPKFCGVCGSTLQHKQTKACSIKCSNILNVNPNKPTKEQLEEDISKMTWVDIGKKYNVSDNGARKWARKYDILE